MQTFIANDGRRKPPEQLKTEAMTIVLTKETTEKLVKIATKNRRKKAEMARLMIEEMVEKSN